MTGVAFSVLGVGTAAAQPADETKVEKVTVTGTRLPKRDYNTLSPVTTVGSQQLEMTQTTSVETLLNDLPELIPGNTFTSNNAGGEDFATLDLRGIGPNRTLIMVNGHRMPAASTTGVTDINGIPAGLVDRIEVVTGGASAVYGSDAMSGVVNFILKDNYEGAELVTTFGSGENGMAETRDFQGLVGGNFAGGNGNITVFGEYFSREGVLQGKQSWSRQSGTYCYTAGQYLPIVTHDGAVACQNSGGLVGAGGSGTPPWGWIANNPTNRFDAATINATIVADYNPTTPGVQNFASSDRDCNSTTANTAYPNGGALSFNDQGQLTPRFTSGACGLPVREFGSSRYNFAPDNYIVLPAERYNISAFGHYDLNENLRFNFGAIYSDARTDVQLAPTPATGIPVIYTDALDAYLIANHPDLRAALQARAGANNINGDADDRDFANFVMDRRTTELGTRNGHNEDSSLSLMSDLKGNINDVWSYEISGSFADVDFISKLENSLNKTAAVQGLSGCMQKSNGPDGIEGTADDFDVPLGPTALPGCTQVDFFGPGRIVNNAGPDGLVGTADDHFMINFLTVDTWSRTSIEEAILGGFVSGDLFDLFAGPISGVFGVEYRYSHASFEVDNEQRTGNIYGFNALQNQNGTVDVYEAYSEVSVPLLKDLPFAYYLGVEAGYRASDYSTVGYVHTYKYGGEYSPFEWLKFRGIFNKATRAPSVFEGFQSGDQGFANFVEPCRDVNADGVPDNTNATLAECIANGVPAGAYPGFIANNAQVQVFSFGNPNLAPETAETLTFGAVLQTGNDWFGIGNLRASVDRYEIDITNFITTLGSNFFLTDCFTNNVASSCARIHRNTATGQISSIDLSRANGGGLNTSGVDVQLDYRLNLEDVGLWGVLTINDLYSQLDEFVFDADTTDGNPGGHFEGTNSSGIGGTFPDYKNVLTGTYTIDDWSLFTRWSYAPETVSINLGIIGATAPIAPAASYVDMAVRYTPVDWMSVTLTVNNVADESSPITMDGILFGQANTDPQLYDNGVVGRFWSIQIRTKM